MNYRHEVKHEINYSDRLVLRQRLSAVMQPDPHAIDGKYDITSVYFDNINDKALREKEDGVNHREKFRIRCYNGDTSYICLEKKSKINDLTAKQAVRITFDEAKKILAGDVNWMASDERPLLTELYSKMRAEGLMPKTAVSYTREAYVYAPGNVRITFDSDVRTGKVSTDVFTKNALSIPAGDPVILLEVKWDGFLPDIIRQAVNIPSRHSAAFSKYAVSRIYD